MQVLDWRHRNLTSRHVTKAAAVAHGSPSLRRKRLDLLGAPALVRLAHIGGRLDRRNELQHQVSNTSDADDGGGDLAEDVVVEKDAADEDVD